MRFVVVAWAVEVMQSFHFYKEDSSSMKGFPGFFWNCLDGGRPLDLLYLILLKV